MDAYYFDHSHDPDFEEPDFDIDCDFADPGGKSALRAGKREFPCPTCGREDMLTAKDIALHYQCDICADEAEAGY
jgi:predicted RNA-binding Zn-ribbon protein involved in translation (DUF1610 family)